MSSGTAVFGCVVGAGLVLAGMSIPSAFQAALSLNPFQPTASTSAQTAKTATGATVSVPVAPPPPPAAASVGEHSGNSGWWLGSPADVRHVVLHNYTDYTMFQVFKHTVSSIAITVGATVIGHYTHVGSFFANAVPVRAAAVLLLVPLVASLAYAMALPGRMTGSKRTIVDGFAVWHGIVLATGLYALSASPIVLTHFAVAYGLFFTLAAGALYGSTLSAALPVSAAAGLSYICSVVAWQSFVLDPRHYRQTAALNYAKSTAEQAVAMLKDATAPPPPPPPSEVSAVGHALQWVRKLLRLPAMDEVVFSPAYLLYGVIICTSIYSMYLLQLRTAAIDKKLRQLQKTVAAAETKKKAAIASEAAESVFGSADDDDTDLDFINESLHYYLSFIDMFVRIAYKLGQLVLFYVAVDAIRGRNKKRNREDL